MALSRVPTGNLRERRPASPGCPAPAGKAPRKPAHAASATLAHKTLCLLVIVDPFASRRRGGRPIMIPHLMAGGTPD